jgi:type I restriction enzyme S subunit
MYSRLFAFEGAYASVDDQFDGYFVSNEFPTFDLDGQRVDLGFLMAYFSAPTTWRELAHGSTGLGVRRQRIQPDKLLAHDLWLPPLDEQRRVATVHARSRHAGEASAQRRRVLDALGTALLNQAFSER